ncbi:MAG: hypothetical protein K1X90_12865 [Candidatus Kapabacteria bacterium]|nr:hypothetical protein [Candidatus Kapabacteria bacterium]
MTSGFTILPLFHGSKARFYTVQFDDRSMDEYSIFREVHGVRTHKDFPRLQSMISSMLNKHGARAQYFRTKKYENTRPVCRFELGSGSLRLYCWWWDDVVIIGCGGIKPLEVRKTQEDPWLLDTFTRICYVRDRISSEITLRELNSNPEKALNEYNRFDPL